jgi:hypothetical protein
MENKMSGAAKHLFYQELRGYLDKGMTAQYVEKRRRRNKREECFEPPVYWKRTHGRSHVTLWGHNYLAELGAFNDDD